MSGQRHEGPPARVVFVDCYANDRLFVGDEGFRALADQIRADGTEADLLDLVRDDPPPGKAMDDVLAAVRAAAPDVVVVSRAWSAALVDALRAVAGAAARIVRHSHGAPSAIDAQFDAVVDGEGLRSLLAGAASVSAPAWRRTRSDMAVLRPMPAPSPGARPTIAGPAKGCPFLVDVRTSAVYRDSGIDFDRVQTKGCAFCLDNVGAFAAFPEKVVVDAWLSQLRALRRARPEVREVLLTDERPHPYLPALFAAMLAEPALHGIELLVKSRVDWLEEHADGALGEACELARQSGSVLHVYLVGFESFHQPDLDLFNKAVTVADNIRAVETLRALEARHPGSFEFRRHRAHGIVLFHPWTTPESLLDNAHAMRAVGFHELRSQALRTRLRLYSSVPLHALAERHGLLVDRFDDGRSDRAVEQGYDASIPWKFADRRVEAIFRAANRVAGAMPDLLDADVLEMAARFVLRWPAFADAPDLGALPLLYAPFSWGASPSDVVAVAGAAVAAFDREIEAVAAGEKRACLKEGVWRDDVDALVRAYETMGLAARVVSTHERGGDDGRHGRGNTHAIVAVARDTATLDFVVKHQRAVEGGDPTHIAPMGELMGYPRCCVEAFAAQRAHGDNLDLERAPFRAHPERPLAPPVSRFGSVSLVSHMLCAPDCAPSVELAKARLAVVASIDPAASERIASHLATPVLRLDYRRAALLEGAWEGERYVVRALRPLARADLGVEPASVRAIRLTPHGVVFELADGHKQVVAATAPLLIEPGTVLAPPVRRAIEDAVAAMHDSLDADTTAPRQHAPAGSVAEVLAVSTRVGDYIVENIEADGVGGFSVTLFGQSRSVRIYVRPWDASRPALSRRGPWGLDLDSTGQASGADRAVVGALARLLPAGDRHAGPTADPGIAARAGEPSRVSSRASSPDAASGVICTAPWTTLEVVDPDGRARQCCADWTVGDRGNLNEYSLVDVWNGEGYRMARRVMGGGALGKLCNQICPRLYDAKFAERTLSIVPGAEPFVANQKLLLEDVAARREVVRAKPLYIAVCPSTYCNYDCIMCLHGRSPRRDLPESIWEDLLAMLPTLRVLTLLGGEPLANPLAMKFLRAWDRTNHPDAAVSLVTNGSLLGASVLAHLDNCHFGSVTVSLNAGTADVYAKVQRGVALADVLANVDALVELRRRQNASFPIVLSFVVQPANYATLVAFGEIARSRGLPIRLMPLSPRGPDGLDYYDDADEVARIVASLDTMAAWAEHAAPDYSREIFGTRSAIANEAASRCRADATPANVTSVDRRARPE